MVIILICLRVGSIQCKVYLKVVLINLVQSINVVLDLFITYMNSMKTAINFAYIQFTDFIAQSVSFH